MIHRDSSYHVYTASNHAATLHACRYYRRYKGMALKPTDPSFPKDTRFITDKVRLKRDTEARRPERSISTGPTGALAN